VAREVLAGYDGERDAEGHQALPEQALEEREGIKLLLLIAVLTAGAVGGTLELAESLGVA
jgi:hypothetical protein